MEGQVGGLAGHGEVHCRAVPGAPPAVLGDAACDAGCLLVVGPTRRGRAGAALLGTTAQRVLHGARIPVLVLRGALPPAPRVLFCVDVASPDAAATVRRGLAAVAALFPGVAVRGTRCSWWWGWRWTFPSPGLHDRLAAAARERLDAFVAELPEGRRAGGAARAHRRPRPRGGGRGRGVVRGAGGGGDARPRRRGPGAAGERGRGGGARRALQRAGGPVTARMRASPGRSSRHADALPRRRALARAVTAGSSRHADAFPRRRALARAVTAGSNRLADALPRRRALARAVILRERPRGTRTVHGPRARPKNLVAPRPAPARARDRRGSGHGGGCAPARPDSSVGAIRHGMDPAGASLRMTAGSGRHADAFSRRRFPFRARGGGMQSPHPDAPVILIAERDQHGPRAPIVLPGQGRARRGVRGRRAGRAGARPRPSPRARRHGDPDPPARRAGAVPPPARGPRHRPHPRRRLQHPRRRGPRRRGGGQRVPAQAARGIRLRGRGAGPDRAAPIRRPGGSNVPRDNRPGTPRRDARSPPTTRPAG